MLQTITNKLKSLLRGGFFHIITGSFLIKAISMISSIVIARIIDKTDYAYLAYADNLYSYITLISGLGLSSALLLFCGKEDGKNMDSAYLNSALTLGCLFDLLVSILLSVVVLFVKIPYPESKQYVILLALYPAISCCITTLLFFLRSKLENKVYAKATVIQSVIVFVVGIGLAVLASVKGLILARYIAAIVTLLYIWKYIQGDISRGQNQKLNHAELKKFVYMGITLLAANLFSGMMPYNEMFLVNHIIRDEASTANFRIAGQFPPLLLIIAGAIMTYYFPIVAKMTDWKVIRRTVCRIGIFCFALLLAIAIIGMLLNPLVINILYGDKYLDAIPLTYVLWIMRAMNACIRMTPINMFPAIGEAKFNMYMSFASCIVQTIIDFYFIKKFGIMGVAWGAIIVYFISGVIYWVYFADICRREIKKQEAANDN